MSSRAERRRAIPLTFGVAAVPRLRALRRSARDDYGGWVRYMSDHDSAETIPVWGGRARGGAVGGWGSGRFGSAGGRGCNRAEYGWRGISRDGVHQRVSRDRNSHQR